MERAATATIERPDGLRAATARAETQPCDEAARRSAAMALGGTSVGIGVVIAIGATALLSTGDDPLRAIALVAFGAGLAAVKLGHHAIGAGSGRGRR